MAYDAALAVMSEDELIFKAHPGLAPSQMTPDSVAAMIFTACPISCAPPPIA